MLPSPAGLDQCQQEPGQRATKLGEYPCPLRLGVCGHPTTGRPGGGLPAGSWREGNACKQLPLSRYTKPLGSLLLLVVRCPENRRNLRIKRGITHGSPKACSSQATDGSDKKRWILAARAGRGRGRRVSGRARGPCASDVRSEVSDSG